MQQVRFGGTQSSDARRLVAIALFAWPNGAAIGATGNADASGGQVQGSGLRIRRGSGAASWRAVSVPDRSVFGLPRPAGQGASRVEGETRWLDPTAYHCSGSALFDQDLAFADGVG